MPEPDARAPEPTPRWYTLAVRLSAVIGILTAAGTVIYSTGRLATRVEVTEARSAEITEIGHRVAAVERDAVAVRTLPQVGERLATLETQVRGAVEATAAIQRSQAQTREAVARIEGMLRDRR